MMLVDVRRPRLRIYEETNIHRQLVGFRQQRLEPAQTLDAGVLSSRHGSNIVHQIRQEVSHRCVLIDHISH